MNYKHWLKNIFIILIGLFIFFQSVLLSRPYLGTNKTEEYVYYKRDWIRSEIGKKREEKCNIVVLGDSMTASSVLPNIFDEYSSYSNTINLSIVSSDAQRHKYFLKDFIKYNYIPDVVIWNPSVPRALKYYLNASKIEVFDYYDETKEIQFLLDYYLPALNHEKVKNVLLSIFKPRKEIDQTINSLKKERGTYYWIKNKYQSVGKNYINEDYNSSKFPELIGSDSNYKKHLIDFLNFTEKLNIKVFIISAPMVDKSSLPLAKIPNIYKKIKKKYPHVFLSDTLISTYYPSELFFDRGHMNYDGAKIYTKDLLKSFSVSNICD